MLSELFHRINKTPVENSNLTTRMGIGRFLQPKSLKRSHQQAKEFNSDQDVKTNGLNYFTSLYQVNQNQPAYKVIHYYTGMGYKIINEHERSRVKSKGKSELSSLWELHEEKNNIMSNELQKHTIKKDLFVFKGIDSDRFEIMKNSGDAKSFCDLKGTIIRDRGFVSTTLLSARIMHKEFVLKIKVPAGTHAAYVSGISFVPEEKELLLDRDQSMVITDIKIKNGITTIECELLKKDKLKSTSNNPLKIT